MDGFFPAYIFTKVDLLGNSSHTQLSIKHFSCFTQSQPSTTNLKVIHGYPSLAPPFHCCRALSSVVSSHRLVRPTKLRTMPVGYLNVCAHWWARQTSFLFWGGVPVRLPLNLEPFKIVFTRSLEQEPRGFKVF